MNNGRQIASKKAKMKVLLQDERIAPHIPETRIYSVNTLRSMLAKYGAVVLKPNVGTGGNGVIWVGKAGNGYELKVHGSKRILPSFAAIRNAVHALTRRRLYLAQQGIRLAKISGRPLDYRIKVVKRDDKWVTAAFVGRLARRGLFVTNLCKGGTQLSSTSAIRRSLPHINVSGKKQEMRELANTCKEIYANHYPNADRLGFDFGLDTSGKIWIFELNTRPH